MRFETNYKEEEWNKKYELAKAYYEHYGNLEIPQSFKTKNGYEYDENGVALGKWINTQRQAFKGNSGYKISKEQIELLKEIGMRFETNYKEEEWNKKYELAKAYYEHYGNLEIPQSFKTKNGYEYDENGVALGKWINTQRQAFKGNSGYKISKEQIELLKEIGMRFETNYKEEEWNKKYELAKAYFEHYGNLEIPANFKTKHGYEYDENGVALGNWINNQRQAFKGNSGYKISKEQIELLKEIGMRFETNYKEEEWNKKYELAKAYFEHYGNLEIPANFKTKHGYEYDENGVALGNWINNQRQAFKGNSGYKISKEQIELLKEIGMRFETNYKEEEWNKKYELAKAYYEHYGNLEIPQSFKTKNGYEYDENGVALGKWINTQRDAFKGNGRYKISKEQIKLLKEIGMKWFPDNIDIKLQKEEINEKNINKKKIEVYNRVIDYLSKYKSDEIPKKEEINSKFIEELDRPLKK